jgi:hypothetical protein
MEKLLEWNENVGISWWKEGRVKLNKVIRKYNKWIDLFQDDKVKTAKLLVKINEHLQMHYSNQDGGSGYKEELMKMKQNVEEILVS